jgi:hypothetical protein
VPFGLVAASSQFTPAFAFFVTSLQPVHELPAVRRVFSHLFNLPEFSSSAFSAVLIRLLCWTAGLPC